MINHLTILIILSIIFSPVALGKRVSSSLEYSRIIANFSFYSSSCKNLPKLNRSGNSPRFISSSPCQKYTLKKINKISLKIQYINIDNSNNLIIYHSGKDYVRFNVLQMNNDNKLRSIINLTRHSDIRVLCHVSQLEFCKSRFIRSRYKPLPKGPLL